MATQPQHPTQPPQHPAFPGESDLYGILNMQDTRLALDALRILVRMELASVYTSAGSNDTRWQVWLEMTQRRVPLAEWAAEWVETWHRTTPLQIHRTINETLYGADDGKEGGA